MNQLLHVNVNKSWIKGKYFVHTDFPILLRRRFYSVLRLDFVKYPNK